MARLARVVVPGQPLGEEAFLKKLERLLGRQLVPKRPRHKRKAKRKANN